MPTADSVQNTNRWDNRQLVVMALMAAIAALFQFIQIPIYPAAPFLQYDPSLVPAMIVGFAFGPAAGIVVGIVAAAIHGLIMGEWVGALMNMCATIFFVLPAGLIYKKKHDFKGAIIGLVAGVIFAIIGCVFSNLTIGMAWYGSYDVILPLMVPAVLPFNALKGVLNAVITLVVYKAISNLIVPKKDQVKGR